MCSGDCGGGGGHRRSSNSHSYTPKKMQGSPKKFSPKSTMGGASRTGAFKAAASFGSPRVGMSFGRKRNY